MSYSASKNISVTLNDYQLIAYFSVVSNPDDGAVTGSISNICLQTTSGATLDTFPSGYSYSAEIVGVDGPLVSEGTDMEPSFTTLYPTGSSAEYTARLTLAYDDYVSSTKYASNSEMLVVDIKNNEDSDFVPHYIVSSKVTRLPYKLEYNIGECFDISGLIYTVVFSNTAPVDYTSGFWVPNGEDYIPFTSEGTYSVAIYWEYDGTVEQGNNSETFYIEVTVKQNKLVWVRQDNGAYVKATNMWVYNENSKQYTSDFDIYKNT